MIENIQILYPEIFLSLSILIILMIGVFIKNSYNLVTNLTFLTLLVLIAILLNEKGNTLIFSEAFISDSFSIFIKILILISSLFILYSSQVFIKDSIRYFVRGGLEFNSAIIPEIEVQNVIMKQEVFKLIQSLRWQDK